MPPMPVGQGQPQGQSTMQKLTMGATMGGTVGLILGFIYGSYAIIKFGPGPNGMMRTMGQYMMGSSATFGFFMAIGHTIRTDSHRAAFERFRHAERRPIMLPADFKYPDDQRSKADKS
ncbi:hypothetical protein BT63DRAFT_419837 [Microthyrium microscopicum]|uniref:Mitochondrial genome maintenance protein Mgr2 n=1 Tax=Microthyrium microscopicum TaxID=703497 RepID=A0A6A6UQK9_9PEZI|nr:hypothetical protein BT63DRAFT_419837 [Microthyrium microscopicum]